MTSERTYGESALLTPANMLTASRLLVAPLFIYLIVFDRISWWTALVGFLAAMSDYFDGIVARRHGTTTSGAFLDPLADKVIVLGSLYALDPRAPARTQELHHPRRHHHGARDLDERLPRPRRASRHLDPGEQARQVEDLHPGLGDRLLRHTDHRALHLDRCRDHLARGRADDLHRMAVLQRGQEGRSCVRVEIVAVGTELLLGQIPDTNSQWLGEQLAAHGIASQFHQHVGDNHERILLAFRTALARSDAVDRVRGTGTDPGRHHPRGPGRSDERPARSRRGDRREDPRDVRIARSHDAREQPPAGRRTARSDDHPPDARHGPGTHLRRRSKGRLRRAGRAL